MNKKKKNRGPIQGYGFTRIFLELAVETGLEGAVIMDYMFFKALSSDDDGGLFICPIRELMEELPYLSCRKICKGIKSSVDGGYLEIVGRNRRSQYVYRVTREGWRVFGERQK